MPNKPLAIIAMAIAIIIMTVSCGTRKPSEVPSRAATEEASTSERVSASETSAVSEPASSSENPNTGDAPSSTADPAADSTSRAESGSAVDPAVDGPSGVEAAAAAGDEAANHTDEAASDQVAGAFDRSAYPDPDTLARKFSYCFAIYLASNYGEQTSTYYWMYKQQLFPELDDDYASIGLYDFANGSLIYTVDEINGILAEYQDDYNRRVEAQAAANLKRAEDFLADNRDADGVRTTGSGLQYRVLVQGSGEMAAATDSVELDYELKTLDGVVIDSSYARGEHATFAMDAVIEGFREGVMLMPMGSRYLFYIHPDLGYGANATGSMEANTLLIFEVETYSIVR